MKWTKFKDEIPKRNPIVYVTDFVSVWTRHFLTWTEFAKANPDYGWSEIPTPEVPIDPKELHYCKEGDICCREERSANRTLNLWLKCSHGDLHWVEFCPLCGYSSSSH